MNKVYTLAGIALLIFLLGMVLGWSISERNCAHQIERPAPTTRTTSHPDSTTVPMLLRPMPLKLHAHANSHLVDSTRSDSLTHHIACIDTLLIAPTAGSPDTLHVCYDTPADSFAIDVRFAVRDTNVQVRYIAHDSVIEHTQIIQLESKAWYVEPVEILSSIVFGFLLGNLKK